MAIKLDEDLTPEVVLFIKETARDFHYKLIDAGVITEENASSNNARREYLIAQLTSAAKTLLKFN